LGTKQPVNRTDNLQSYDENFCYDALNRLNAYAVNNGGGGTCTSGTIEKTVNYDPTPNSDGNIASKSDLGGYTYGQSGAGPHAVTSVNTTSAGGCTLTSNCMLEGVQNICQVAIIRTFEVFLVTHCRLTQKRHRICLRMPQHSKR
jgi:hypothetical protein